MIDLDEYDAINILDKKIESDVRHIIVNQYRDIESNACLLNMIKRLNEYDEVTYIHSINVAIYAVAIGVKINLSEPMLGLLAQAGMFHDIGKLLISKKILNKNSRLTDDEFSLIKMHSKYGADICRSLGFPNIVVTGIYEHHERYSGRGYPQGLEGEAISVFGRVLSVADVYDALVSSRPYHKSFSPSKPIEDLGSDPGYDKRMVYAFFEAIEPYPSNIKCTVVDISNNSKFRVEVQ